MASITIVESGLSTATRQLRSSQLLFISACSKWSINHCFLFGNDMSPDPQRGNQPILAATNHTYTAAPKLASRPPCQSTHQTTVSRVFSFKYRQAGNKLQYENDASPTAASQVGRVRVAPQWGRGLPALQDAAKTMTRAGRSKQTDNPASPSFDCSPL